VKGEHMTTRKKKPAEAQPAIAQNDPNEMRIEGDKLNREQLLADLSVEGLFTNVALMKSFSARVGGDIAITEAMLSMRRSLANVHRGDLRQLEAMLLGQAAALNAMFAEFTNRAGLNLGDNLDRAERFARLALKSQGQCRATLETLAAIKNPPVVFARQANINNGGNQQVNNGPVATVAAERTHAHAERNESSPIELLEAQDGERLDTGKTGAAGSVDNDLAAMGARNGANVRGGQGSSVSKRVERRHSR